MRVITSHHLRPRRRDEERAARSALRASIDAVVVVGASSESTPSRGRVPRIHAESPSDLNAAWFLCCSTVSLVPGPHATAQQIAAVQTALEQLP
jgi:hypothetical protein